MFIWESCQSQIFLVKNKRTNRQTSTQTLKVTDHYCLPFNPKEGDNDGKLILINNVGCLRKIKKPIQKKKCSFIADHEQFQRVVEEFRRWSSPYHDWVSDKMGRRFFPYHECFHVVVRFISDKVKKKKNTKGYEQLRDDKGQRNMQIQTSKHIQAPMPR